MMEIPGSFRLRQYEKAWFDGSQEKLSFKANPYYLGLARASEAVRTQLIPNERELEILDYESPDPLSEEDFSPLPRMVHRYKNRIALLLTDNCSIHCRHCFRRSFTGKGHSVLSKQECARVVEYLNGHPEVREILVTGGDPLTLTDSRLEEVLTALRRAVRGDRLLLRIATRIPAVQPGRITPELVNILKDLSPLWMVMQFNHPHELTAESRRALKMIRNAGIPMVNQSVLLKGVNDDADTLGELFQELLSEAVKPYYLFQGDLAGGTSHFRVPLERGWKIMDELRDRVSGLALPVYAVDLPCGGGKIPLERGRLLRTTSEAYVFRSNEDDGREYEYPREKE